MRKYLKYIVLLMALVLSITFANTKAAVGYNYSHRGEPIHSSIGMSASSSGIFTVISEGWAGLTADEFTSPEDMFLFTETVNGIEQDVIYVVDSNANALYVFDENLNLRPGDAGKITKFEIRPDDFNEAEFNRVNTGGTNGSVKFNTTVSWEVFSDALMTPYENRSDAQKWYISPLKVSGVYRALRPYRDENGVIQKGVYEDLIYISDKGNNQIIIVDANDYHVVQVVSTPTDISFQDKVFAPSKVITDVTGRMFVISEGVYEGIMQMSYQGNFMSFVGVNFVNLTPWEIFWRRFSTEEQLAQMESVLNTEFKNLTIDKDGFIYTVARAVTNSDDVTDTSAMIKRINPSGNDVLTRNGYNIPVGDIVTIETGQDTLSRGPSRFTAIAVNEYGVYTVSDEKSGRLFTYDDEGNLLYISGGTGNELNNLNNPVSIVYQGENILVLDKLTKAIIRFEPTDIAKVINRAVKYHYEGQLEEAAEEWKNVVAENPNYELAYVGIGKSLLNEGRYEEAMAYFRIGYNKQYYSRAYKLYRDEVIKQNFTGFMSVVAVLIVAGVGYNIYKKKKNPKMNDAGVGDE